MYFPTANLEISWYIPPLVAFGISFFTSMGGVSGAFLLLPFQMSILGYTSPSVSATNQVFNIVAIPSGVYRYWKEGRMVWPLTLLVILGTLPGVFLGAIIRVIYLPDPRNFKFFAGLVLAYIGLKMVKELNKQKLSTSEKKFENLVRSLKEKSQRKNLPGTKVIAFNWKKLAYSFYGEEFEVSFWGIFTLTFVVGIIGGIYGIGGGAIIAPFLVTFFELPVYTIAGAALMGTFVTSIAGVIFYQLLAPFYPHLSVAPDWRLGLLFGLGGMAGIYLGARCQKYIPAKFIKIILILTIFITSLKYILNFLI
ncbi:MAG: hypothetical protein XD41_1902 [Desulfonauticus sp. 38_4375]|nr:MAG: hypothetical protein XD41_1902 [Desulfonauticus sp. 38_4375]